ncbi:DUF6660 family protein [Pedobacter duraquae]|uniref:Uncharacterized protein n=1 Tax=Pedobacter duraquae TaxID=425511 RepID=A0A4R6IFL4_9SPHI|nr:DUF6660 family protein [Pedobacter duraquae]TDO20824.1 hypothetical protein CLV32_3458 [Pedobacter duraquae]
MKLFTIILGIYFILVAIVPCQDNDGVLPTDSLETSVNIDHSRSDETGQDVCPPFCNCSCCSTPRTIPAQQVLIVFSKILVRRFAQPTIPSTQKQILAIWQPPQLV